jgi:hypothetical protein
MAPLRGGYLLVEAVNILTGILSPIYSSVGGGPIDARIIPDKFDCFLQTIDAAHDFAPRLRLLRGDPYRYSP